MYTIKDYLKNKPFYDNVTRFDVIHARDRLDELKWEDERVLQQTKSAVAAAAGLMVGAVVVDQSTPFAQFCAFLTVAFSMCCVGMRLLCDADYENQWKHYHANRKEILERECNEDW